MADDLEADVNDSPTAITTANWNKDGVVDDTTKAGDMLLMWQCLEHPRFFMVPGQQCPECASERVEAYRQQGRDEVLREIADVEPMQEQGMMGESICVFCNSQYEHEPNCIWLRASQAVKP